MAHRPGFVIPNASDAGVSFRQAEPDAGDFSIIGNGEYGVLSGCDAAVNTLTVSLVGGPHVVVNNGDIQRIPSGSVSLSPGGEVDRFDLVAWDGSALTVIHGTPSDDAKFPEIPDGHVVLWAVLVGSGTSSLSTSNLVDKRKLFTHGAKGSVGANEVFIQNYLSGDDRVGFTITGDGGIQWAADGVSINYFEGPKRIVVSGGKLVADSGIEAGDTSTINGDLYVTGTIHSSDRLKGPVDPNGAGIVGSPGDIYSNTTTGQQYTYRSALIGWAEIYADEYPPGTVIASMLTGTDAAAHMVGWLALDGSSYAASNPVLGRLPSMASFNHWKSGAPGSEVYTLPDTRSAFLMGGESGNLGKVNGSNNKTLTTGNLPAHRHFDGASNTSSSGVHSHTVSVSPAGAHAHTIGGGAHSHAVSDPGHMHSANHGLNIPTSFITMLWGGKYRLVAWSGSEGGPAVDIFQYSTLEKTGITIPSGAAHSHTVSREADHSHTSVVTSSSGHTHALPNESVVGSGAPVDVTPKNLSVVYYVKV